MAWNWKTKAGLAVLAAGCFVAGALISGTLNLIPKSGADENPSADLDALRRIGHGFSSVVKEVSPSVVNVRVSKKVKSPGGVGRGMPFDFFGGSPFGQFFESPPGGGEDFLEQGTGSGVIVSADGYILTNNHVVAGADEITVKTTDGKEFKARVVGTDPHTDLAVIKVDAAGLTAAKLGDSDQVEVGEWVLAIGSPFDLSNTVTSGIISARGRANVGLADYEDFIQTDAAINPGNSGGPLVNLDGEVIGINSAIATRTGGYMGIGFAIPINMAKNVMDQLIKTGKVTRGWLGVYIQPITPELQKQFGLKSTEGALLSDITAGGPSEKAGLKRGDVIVRFKGQPVKDTNQLRNAVAATKVGADAEVVVVRDGKEKTFAVKIGELPGKDAAGGGQVGEGFGTELGFSVQNLTPEIRQRLAIPEGLEGVVVMDVKQASDAYQKGLRQGDVIVEINRIPVASVTDFNRIIGGVKVGDQVLLVVVTEGHTRYVSFTVGK